MIYNERKLVAGGWTRCCMEGLEGGITKGDKEILGVMDVYYLDYGD